MKRTAIAILALATVAAMAAPAQAQMKDNQDKQLTCNDVYRNRDRNQTRVCDVREITLGPSASLDIEPGHNGGITVKGWSRNNVLVRARIEAGAESDREASAIASQVRVDTGGGDIKGTGPDLDNGFLNLIRGANRYWSVSFEIFTPWNTNVKMSSHNGGIDISDIRGKIDFESHNGGVNLSRVAGDVSGDTHNGGINIVLAGVTWEGRQMDVSTHNGGINITVPASFSAHVETETHNGGIDSDFPISVRGKLNNRDLSFNIGSGGPLIKASTHNGGIKLRKM